METSGNIDPFADNLGPRLNEQAADVTAQTIFEMRSLSNFRSKGMTLLSSHANATPACISEFTTTQHAALDFENA